MLRRQILISLTTVVVLPAVLAAAGRDLVVVRPGGPSPSEEAQAQVGRLIEEIAERAGWSSGSASSFYFNDSQQALSHLAANPPGFLLTTPGFFLANHAELRLVPVNQILIDGSDTHVFYVVAQKDSLESLGDLNGGSLAGSALAEPDFVERIVLEGQFDFATDLQAEYQRALSALRRLSRGEVTAVILDAIEYAGLESLPFADQLETVFRSRPIPSTGIFALSDTADRSDVEALDLATREFCLAGEGAAICKTYGISGFKTPDEGVFDDLMTRYVGNQSDR